MTPSLLQKIELLTLNQLELCELMTQEMVKNPFLEEVAGRCGSGACPGRDGRRGTREGEVQGCRRTSTTSTSFSEYLSPPFRNREYEIPDDRPDFRDVPVDLDFAERSP